VKDTSAEVDAPPVTPSAGVFDATDKPIELTLPGAKKVPINDDDFPLDAETDATENIPDNHEQPPFTPSAGVFDLSDTPVELTLPKAKHAKKSTDFPLDAENTAKAPQANSDDMETIVAPSAGISSAAKPIKLAPPPKGKSQAASKLQDATGEDVPLSAAAKQDQLLTTEASKGKTKQDTSRTGQQDGADKAEGNETIQAKMSSKQRMELSRTLAKILRHSAAGESLAVRPDGYISIPALLSRPKLKKLKATLEKIQEVVALDNKSRYALQDFDGVLHIRANQGHSIKVDDLELSRIEDASSLPVILHGTNEAALQLIKQFGGLSKMQRNHIHLATGKYGEEGVISGVRKDCTVFIHIDLAKAMADGIVFYKSANGVILTEGADGVLPEKYFTKIEQPTSSAPPEQNPAISSKKDF
jgi:2'-phosphotransferase